MCLDPAKAQKNLIRTPNSLRNHEQRRASADKLCLGGYPASHTRLVQRIPKETLPLHRDACLASHWEIIAIIGKEQKVEILTISRFVKNFVPCERKRLMSELDKVMLNRKICYDQIR